MARIIVISYSCMWRNVYLVFPKIKLHLIQNSKLSINRIKCFCSYSGVYMPGSCKWFFSLSSKISRKVSQIHMVYYRWGIWLNLEFKCFFNFCASHFCIPEVRNLSSQSLQLYCETRWAIRGPGSHIFCSCCGVGRTIALHMASIYTWFCSLHIFFFCIFVVVVFWLL